MTRAMVMAVLWRMDESPKQIAATNPFTDISSSQYFYEYVLWGAERKIISGYPDRTFRPGNGITRQDLIALLYRYSGAQSTTAEQTQFSDWNTVSDYAKSAVSWAVSNGLLTGDDHGHLNPKKEITRAEVAALLTRYLKNA